MNTKLTLYREYKGRRIPVVIEYDEGMTIILPERPPKQQPQGKPAAHPPQEPSAKIRMRRKGQLDGPVYEGQKLVIPYKTCPGSETKPRSSNGTKPNQELPD